MRVAPALAAVFAAGLALCALGEALDAQDEVSIELRSNAGTVLSISPDGKISYRGREIIDDVEVADALRDLVMMRPCGAGRI